MNLSPAYVKWKEKILQEGIQIGEQRGIEIGIQRVARNLLQTDMNPTQVA